MAQIPRRSWLIGVSGRTTYFVDVTQVDRSHDGLLDGLSLDSVGSMGRTPSHLRLNLGEDVSSAERFYTLEQVGSSPSMSLEHRSHDAKLNSVIGNPIVVLDHAHPDPLSHGESIEMLHHVIQKLEEDLARERELHQTYVQRTTRKQDTLRIHNKRLQEEKSQLLETLEAESSARVAVQERQRASVQATHRRLTRLEEKHADYKREVKDLRARQACICGICYSNVCDVVTLCGHQFCGACLRQWHLTPTALGRALSCPTCRCALVRDEVIEEDQVALKLHHN